MNEPVFYLVYIFSLFAALLVESKLLRSRKNQYFGIPYKNEINKEKKNEEQIVSKY